LVRSYHYRRDRDLSFSVTGRLPCDLNGDVALVSGCGSENGIGFACAHALGAIGARVAITSTTDRIHTRAKELRDKGVETLGCVGDLTVPGDVERVIADAESKLGPIDILVNAAGLAQSGVEAPSGRMADLTREEWMRELDVNLMTAVNPARVLLPGMSARRYGRIVMISSVTGPVVAAPRLAGYAAAKAGMDGLMRSIALEYGRLGITANSVAPGWIATAASTEEERRAGAHTPVGRPGSPDEVAALVAFLACRAATYITGQSVIVDGGNTIQEGHGIDLYGEPAAGHG
jgi:3-oxoacyl-[acyl-carrier protein] reductase